MKRKSLYNLILSGLYRRLVGYVLLMVAFWCLWELLEQKWGCRGVFSVCLMTFLAVFFVLTYGLASYLRSFLKEVLFYPLKSLLNQLDQDASHHYSVLRKKGLDLSEKAPEEWVRLTAHYHQVACLSSKKEEEEAHAALKAPLAGKHEEIERLRDGIVAALEQANLFNDDDTGMHMKRLGIYSRFLAEKKGLDVDFSENIQRYASLHDVGKIGIPDDILKKPDRLTADEWSIMQTHSKIGYDILKSVGLHEMALNIALYHHEKWNGTGYPEGLKGEDIPIEARIVAIADVFDALANPRVYKPGFDRVHVEKIMRSEIGRHFDPELGQMACDNLDKFYEVLKQNYG